jgi:predicted transcriptional regulator
MSDPKPALGSTEIEVLRYLGDQPALTVGDVAAHFAATTGQARTTILTLMERLRKKGYLSRRRVDGVFRYSPRVRPEVLLRGLVKDFVDTTLAGSVSPFVAYLSDGGPVSEQELDELRRLVRDLDRARKDGAK